GGWVRHQDVLIAFPMNTRLLLIPRVVSNKSRLGPTHMWTEAAVPSRPGTIRAQPQKRPPTGRSDRGRCDAPKRQGNAVPVGETGRWRSNSWGARQNAGDRGCQPRSNEIGVSSFGALAAARTPLRRKH